MNVIAIRGIGSKIASELINILGNNEEVFEVSRCTMSPLNAERYLFCQGLLYGKKREEATCEEIALTYKVNYIDVAASCEYILMKNPVARICVIGSESGISGSYDECYADAKRLLHHYIETRGLEDSRQQLVCVAPWIIEDSSMTMRRTDRENLSRVRDAQPKKRFALAAEVAQLVKFLLYTDRGYITNTVIRMNGGRV